MWLVENERQQISLHHGLFISVSDTLRSRIGWIAYSGIKSGSSRSSKTTSKQKTPIKNIHTCFGWYTSTSNIHIKKWADAFERLFIIYLHLNCLREKFGGCVCVCKSICVHKGILVLGYYFPLYPHSYILHYVAIV